MDFIILSGAPIEKLKDLSKGAQHFAGMTLEEAVRKAEAAFDSPY